MLKMPFSYRFRAWLLRYWFTSFEGGMVRDVWLREGMLLERKRIIKLLENDMALAIGIDGKCRYEEHYAEACHCDIIALIKGENNVA